MGTALDEAILRLAGRDSTQGVTMGAIVDELVMEGEDAEHVERAVWKLLETRRLTPTGYVCRALRRREGDGGAVTQRTYEFLLIPWSPDMDRQLELSIEAKS